jgi:trimeric autotransporter adhesin
MALPTTLLDFWKAQKTAAATALSDAQKALTTAQTNLAASRASLAKTNGELADLSKTIAGIRAKLAESETMADGEALLAELATAIRDARAKQAEALKVEADLAAAQTALDMATSEVTVATSDLAGATTAAVAAEQKSKDRTALTGALSAVPLDSMVADATSALAAAQSTDAQARIEADIPTELRDCARARAAVERARMTNDAARSAEVATLVGAASADADRLLAVFQDAEAALRAYVLNAERRYKEALAVFTRVADSKQNPLTKAESDAIESKKSDGTTDAVLEGKRHDAAAKAQAVAGAQETLDAKKLALEIARLKARAKDLDADPEADAAVIAAKAAVTAADTALTTAKSDFTAAMEDDLAGWEAAVPDTSWRMLADFDDARQALNDLKTAPAPLATALTNAEQDLVTALLAAGKSARTLRLLETEASMAAAVEQFDTGALSRRIVGAMRGDS